MAAFVTPSGLLIVTVACLSLFAFLALGQLLVFIGVNEYSSLLVVLLLLSIRNFVASGFSLIAHILCFLFCVSLLGHLHIAQESSETSEEQKIILGHHFSRKSKKPGSKSTCDRCGAIIWRMLQPWYRCTGKTYDFVLYT